ncbi:MAG: hypothetical protein ABJQ70_15000 [Roseobacter sp.]
MKKAIIKILLGVGILAISFVVLVPSSHQFHGDNVEKIEAMLSSTERVGTSLQGTKVVTAGLELCELRIRTDFDFPDPNPVGTKFGSLILDLHTVGEVEQREFMGKYFLDFNPHGFGSPFRKLGPLKASKYRVRWDGHESSYIEDCPSSGLLEPMRA